MPSFRAASWKVSIHRRPSATVSGEPADVETLGVSVSGYYIWRKRPMSQHPREDGDLAERIQAAYHANRGVYRGHGAVRECMQSYRLRGSSARGTRVTRLMHEWELAARRPRHRTKTTRSDPNARVAPNRLDRDFAATRPNEKWAGDIPAIWTSEGWLYLAAVLDLFSRRVARMGDGRIG